MQIASVTIILSFILLSVNFDGRMSSSDLSAGIAYIIIGMIFSSISSLTTNYYKRVQYINSKILLKSTQTDSMTGIYNRSKFNEELSGWIAYSQRYKAPLSMAIFDFDNFKDINDKYGHLIGDKVIIDMVKLISSEIRQNDIFARWGGEEFALLLPNTQLEQAIELVERLRYLIASHNFGIYKNVTCSFGLASMKQTDTPDSFLQRADNFLYDAKRAGKNTVAS